MDGGFSHYGDTFPDDPLKFRVYKERINGQGYTRQGFYYGAGAPIYHAESECGQVFGTWRTYSRDKVKAEVLRLFPNARFYR
jgi:hypothetical protein